MKHHTPYLDEDEDEDDCKLFVVAAAAAVNVDVYVDFDVTEHEAVDVSELVAAYGVVAVADFDEPNRSYNVDIVL